MKEMRTSESVRGKGEALRRESNHPPPLVLPPLVHLCVPALVLPGAPAVAAQRRERAPAAPQQAGALRHLRHLVLGLVLGVSASTPTAAVRSRSDGTADLVALHRAPDAFQALAALEAGAGGADAGGVVGGGAGDGDGDLAGAVASSRHWFIDLRGTRGRDEMVVCAGEPSCATASMLPMELDNGNAAVLPFVFQLLLNIKGPILCPFFILK